MSERTGGAPLLLLLVVLCALASGTGAAAGHGLDRADGTAPLHAAGADGFHTIDDADRNLSSGGTFWQGQTVAFDDPNGTVEGDRLHLREYDEETDEPGTLVREFEVDGPVRIDTATLSGTYVLVPAGQRTKAVVVDNGTITGTTDMEAAAPFEVLVQTLDARLVGSGTGNGTVETDLELELTSNRARYNVNVTAPDLTFDDLESAFIRDRLLRDQNAPHADRPPIERRADGYGMYADDDVIVLRGFADGRLRSDFGEAESIPRAVTVEVADTGVTDTAEISARGIETGPFEITEVTAPGSVAPGSTVTLSATVRNRWSATSERTVTFRLGDGAETAIEPSLPGGASTTVSTTLSAPTEPGEYEFVVDTDGDSANGTITVTDPNGSDGASDGEESDGDGGNESDEDGGESDGSDEDGSDGDGDGPIAIDVDLRLGAGALLTLLSGAGVVAWRRR
ncbi:hypothetical protein FK85_02595 [Halorubrum saccharovorum]|uniref:CARDB domain-containing protein n=1 Tax=Halorubrum saccharovorum TaxID=2248 RepID=A0A081EVF5_9EURY|nr:CARDB domain-containing protein [Halorubrum saccharovorum]KDS91393.1 hypothetical protein FK85_02595 [Halorubrum saccharovorum]